MQVGYWGVGPNKSRATKKHDKWNSNPYIVVGIGSLYFGDIAQHKDKYSAAATYQWQHSDKDQHGPTQQKN